MVYQTLHTYIFQSCLDAGMQNDDKALPSIGLAGGGQLEKTFIHLIPHRIFDRNMHTYTFYIV